MSSKLTLEVLTEVESHFPVQSWEVRGVKLWPAIRIWLGARLLHPSAGAERSIRGVNWGSLLAPARRWGRASRKAVRVTAAYLSDRTKNQSLDREYPVVIMMASSHRRVHRSEGWYAVYSDPFVDLYRAMGYQTLVLERGVNRYRLPRYSDSYFVSPAPPWLAGRELTRSGGDTVQGALEGYSEVQAIVAKRSGIQMPDRAGLDQMAGRVRAKADAWGRIFDRVQPRVGFTVCYYNLDGFGFNLACSERGIPSIDIQHGVQGHLHYAYGQWTGVPSEGYALLPDCFWCWSDGDAAAIRAWSKESGAHRAVSGGNPWLDVWRSHRLEFEAGFTDAVSRVKEGGKVHVLYTCDRNPELPGPLIEAIRDSEFTWIWWIRMHPGMNESERHRVADQLRGLADGRIEMDLATRAPLPMLLEFANAHVTRYSTVVVEAEAWCTGSVILDPVGEEYFQERIETGSAIRAHSGSELLHAVLDFVSRGTLSPLGTPGSGGKEREALLRNLVESGTGSITRGLWGDAEVPI